MLAVAPAMTLPSRCATLHVRTGNTGVRMRGMGMVLAWWLVALPAMACDRPTSFKASIGGFFGPSFAVELTPEGDLRYASNPRTFVSDDAGTTRETVKVAPAAWQRLCNELDAIGAWRWKPNYVDASVHDGTSWSFEIEVDGQSLKSGGYNAWPGGSVSSPGASSADTSFQAWLHAVSALVGGRDFH